jgi:hypothetical protein
VLSSLNWVNARSRTAADEAPPPQQHQQLQHSFQWEEPQQQWQAPAPAAGTGSSWGAPPPPLQAPAAGGAGSRPRNGGKRAHAPTGWGGTPSQGPSNQQRPIPIISTHLQAQQRSGGGAAAWGAAEHGTQQQVAQQQQQPSNQKGKKGAAAGGKGSGSGGGASKGGSGGGKRGAAGGRKAPQAGSLTFELVGGSGAQGSGGGGGDEQGTGAAGAASAPRLKQATIGATLRRHQQAKQQQRGAFQEPAVQQPAAAAASGGKAASGKRRAATSAAAATSKSGRGAKAARVAARPVLAVPDLLRSEGADAAASGSAPCALDASQPEIWGRLEADLATAHGWCLGLLMAAECCSPVGGGGGSAAGGGRPVVRFFHTACQGLGALQQRELRKAIKSTNAAAAALLLDGEEGAAAAAATGGSVDGLPPGASGWVAAVALLPITESNHMALSAGSPAATGKLPNGPWRAGPAAAAAAVASTPPVHSTDEGACYILTLTAGGSSGDSAPRLPAAARTLITRVLTGAGSGAPCVCCDAKRVLVLLHGLGLGLPAAGALRVLDPLVLVSVSTCVRPRRPSALLPARLLPVTATFQARNNVQNLPT